MGQLKFRTPLCIPVGILVATITCGTGTAAANPHEQKKTIEYVADATEPANGRLLYREKHHTTLKDGEPLTSKTVYFGPKGQKWAVLSAEYASARDRFSHRYDDLRSGASFGVALNRAGVPVMFNRDSKEEAFERKPYTGSSGDPVAVAGQGFHWLIREKVLRGELKPGSSLKFRLLIPGRFDYFSFKIKTASERSGLVYLNVTLASLFLRMIANAEMRLVYERKTGRLVNTRPDGHQG